MKQALVSMLYRNPPIFPPKQSEISPKNPPNANSTLQRNHKRLIWLEISHLPTVHAIFRRQIEQGLEFHKVAARCRLNTVPKPSTRVKTCGERSTHSGSESLCKRNKTVPQAL